MQCIKIISIGIVFSFCNICNAFCQTMGNGTIVEKSSLIRSKDATDSDIRNGSDSKDRAKTIHQLSLELHPSYVIPTHKFLRKNNQQREPINFSLSGHLKYAFQFKKGTKYNKMYPHAYQGIGIGYGSFFSDELGSPIGCYAFQGSRIAELRKGVTLDYEWNFGVTFGWTEYHKQHNTYNHVIGTDIDAYMNLGLKLNWQLSAHYHLTTGLALSHFSNANTHYPNQGLNQLEARVGVVRTIGDTNAESSFNSTTQATLLKPRHVSYDFILYGAFRVREINKNKKKYIPDHEFGVYGINFTPMYHWNNSLSTGVSLDLQYDDSSNLENHVASLEDNKVTFHDQPFREKISAGISVRGEWAMPIFAINAGIGYNVYAKSFDTKKFYQILAMKIFMNPHIFIHIGYQMNQFKDPNNLMLGLGYRLH